MHYVTNLFISAGKNSVKNGSNEQLSSSARVSTITSNANHDDHGDDDINDWGGDGEDEGDNEDINFI